ncbi:TRAF3 [Bugula neritina]|uniref:TRAF3 n=1 Tax=Bugula neritina TaxID=10212 RepID=A0A7J7JB98_BUGNE|nr:TRAF3 [Bugula neritina]
MKLYKRPGFVQRRQLLLSYSCGICRDIVILPYQTACNKRVCEVCITEKFGNNSVIPCPLLHDNLTGDEEECQREGLEWSMVYPDSITQKELSRELCFCVNRQFGCCEEVRWKDLQKHIEECPFEPTVCSNEGCDKKYDYMHMLEHQNNCLYGQVQCRYCTTVTLRKDFPEHVEECEKVDTVCGGCSKLFSSRGNLAVHQQTDPGCLLSAGKGTAGSPPGPPNRGPAPGALAIKIQELEDNVENRQNILLRAVAPRVVPLTKAVFGISVKVADLEEQANLSKEDSYRFKQAMRSADNVSRTVGNLQSRVAVLEREVKDTGLSEMPSLHTRTQGLQKNSKDLGRLTKKTMILESGWDNGMLVWKIDQYQLKKRQAVRYEGRFETSPAFFSKKYGYKMCCKAYLNGHEDGRGQYLSLYFVLMKGEYDDILEFPFTERITFKLLAPQKQWLNKEKTILPDPDSSSFRRPQTEMNIASGCPQFALHTDVESSNFLINDCIYVRVSVESSRA